MFTRPEGLDEIVNLRAILLDDHGWFVPFAEFWTREKLPWAATPAVHSFATHPAMEDFPALVEEFARRGARPACPLPTWLPQRNLSGLPTLCQQARGHAGTGRSIQSTTTRRGGTEGARSCKPKGWVH